MNGCIDVWMDRRMDWVSGWIGLSSWENKMSILGLKKSRFFMRVLKKLTRNGFLLRICSKPFSRLVPNRFFSK